MKTFFTSLFDLPLREAESEWTLHTSSPCDPGHRDAFLGNGLIGTRLDPWGDGGSYSPGSCSFMNGLWGDASENPKRGEGAVEMPHWATLGLCTGDRELRRPQAVIRDHEQSLDLRQATLHTRWREDGPDGGLLHQRRAWIARGHRHIAVLEAGVEAAADYDSWRVFVDETLDSLHNRGVSNAVCRMEDGDACHALTYDRFGYRLAIRSRLLFEGEGKPVESVSLCDRVLRRRWVCPFRAGKRLRVTKVVALVSSKQHPDPEAEAKRQLDAACADLEGVRRAHTEAWEQLWRSRIETDHPRLQQLCHASLYTLYATLREDVEEAHGPCGLFGNGWDGHVFWDTDLWTHPVLTLFQPGLGRAVAAYRARTLPGALRNAEANGETGARYAWMSGASGEEGCSEQVFRDERHITSCVAYGQWVYALSAGDTGWLSGPGLKVIRAAATYWAGRAVREEGREGWHILGVCGSDEHAGYVDDNATTNYGAAWTLRKAAELSRAAGRDVPPEWEIIADGLVIPWDHERDIPLQMRDWRHGTIIKQADAILLAHPWHYPMEDATLARTVDYYREHYQKNPIMMGFAIDGILDCRLGRTEQVTRILHSLLDYFRVPFLAPTEAVTNERYPFLTGTGGFLQFLVMGMAGLITDEAAGLRSGWVCLPDGVNRIVLHGLHHSGKLHTVSVTRGHGVSIRDSSEKHTNGVVGGGALS